MISSRYGLPIACACWFTGCSIDPEHAEPDHVCPFAEVQTVAGDDATDLGFTPNDVLAAASVSTIAETAESFDTPESEGAEPLPVQLSHVFTSAGDALLVDYGEPEDPECPMGPALRVPASYSVSGSIGAWSVSATREGFSLVATAAELDSISSDFPVPMVYDWDAEVDAGLQEVAREALGPATPPECTMRFSLGPMPEHLAAGAWGTEVSQGWLASDCANHTAEFLNWTATVTP